MTGIVLGTRQTLAVPCVLSSLSRAPSGTRGALAHPRPAPSGVPGFQAAGKYKLISTRAGTHKPAPLPLPPHPPLLEPVCASLSGSLGATGASLGL